MATVAQLEQLLQKAQSELLVEKSRQAKAVEEVESRLGEQLRSCRKAMADELALCEQMELRLEQKFRSIIEDEAAVRRAVEKHLEAMVIGVRAELKVFIQTELSKALKKELAECQRSVAQEEPEEDLGSTTRSPKNRMSTLQEHPHQEHLERLEEAIEREAASRRQLELSLKDRLDAVLHKWHATGSPFPDVPTEDSKLLETMETGSTSQGVTAKPSGHWMLLRDKSLFGESEAQKTSCSTFSGDSCCSSCGHSESHKDMLTSSEGAPEAHCTAFLATDAREKEHLQQRSAPER